MPVGPRDGRRAACVGGPLPWHARRGVRLVGGAACRRRSGCWLRPRVATPRTVAALAARGRPTPNARRRAPAGRGGSAPRGDAARGACAPSCARAPIRTPPTAPAGPACTRPRTRATSSLARAFLEAGAHPDLRSRARGTPLDVAERGGRAGARAAAAAARRAGAPASRSATPCACGPGAATATAPSCEAADPTRYRLRVSRVVGCAAGCEPEPSCSGGRSVGAGGLGAGRRPVGARPPA